MAFQLESDESVSAGIRRLTLEEVANILEQLTNPQITRDVGVHEARKGCKRVRAALRLVRDEIGAEVFKKENIRFRNVSRRLAAARDSRVKIDVLDSLLAIYMDEFPMRVFDQFRNRLIDDYNATLLLEKKDHTLIPTIMEVIKDSVEILETLPIQGKGFSAMKIGLHRTYTRGQQGMEQSVTNPIPEHFHEWRKRVKYLWHQVEIFVNIKPEVLTILVEDLHNLADTLGDHHDLIVLRRTVLEYPEDFLDEVEMMVLTDWIDQKRLDLESQAYSLGNRIYGRSAEDFCHIMEEYWGLWRLAE